MVRNNGGSTISAGLKTMALSLSFFRAILPRHIQIWPPKEKRIFPATSQKKNCRWHHRRRHIFSSM